jgi:hypothetical protein
MPVRSVGIRDDDGRRPLRAEPLETSRIFFDVNFDRNEIAIDER